MNKAPNHLCLHHQAASLRGSHGTGEQLEGRARKPLYFVTAIGRSLRNTFGKGTGGCQAVFIRAAVLLRAASPGTGPGEAEEQSLRKATGKRGGNFPGRGQTLQ